MSFANRLFAVLAVINIILFVIAVHSEYTGLAIAEAFTSLLCTLGAVSKFK
jgi:hypothetical protein